MNNKITLPKKNVNSKYRDEKQALIKEQLATQDNLVIEARNTIKNAEVHIEIAAAFKITLQKMLETYSRVPTNQKRRRAKNVTFPELRNALLEFEKQNTNPLGLTIAATRDFLAKKSLYPSIKRIRLSFNKLNFISKRYGSKFYYKRINN